MTPKVALASALMLIGVLVRSAAAADQAVVNGFHARNYRSEVGAALPYRLFIPGASKRDRQLPLIVFLHGSGGAGSDNLKQISGGNAPGTHLWTRPDLQSRYPAFVLAPQIPSGSAWASEGDQLSPHAIALLELLTSLRSEFRLDEKRIYLIGQSLGGFGVWDLISRYPTSFAAAVPLCGGGDSARIIAARNVPVWAFHGAMDTAVPVSRSRELIAALRAVNQEVKYTEYADVRHDVWNRAFKEPALSHWLFAQRRE